MNKYEVISLLGEGSFGRVYKAKRISDTVIVALKVISKVSTSLTNYIIFLVKSFQLFQRGRSLKEIKSLRRECEIQKHLHHPNIIQMLDTFETDNEVSYILFFEIYLVVFISGYIVILIIKYHNTFSGFVSIAKLLSTYPLNFK